MTGWVAVLVLGLVLGVIALAARYGADSRPRADQPPEAWWPGR